MKIKVILFSLTIILSCSTFGSKEKKMQTAGYPLSRTSNSWPLENWGTKWLFMKADNNDILFYFTDFNLTIGEVDDQLYFHLIYVISSTEYRPENFYQIFVINFYDVDNRLIGTEKFGIWLPCSSYNRTKHASKIKILPGYILSDIKHVQISAERSNWFKCGEKSKK